jgi:hypothetical protein
MCTADISLLIQQVRIVSGWIYHALPLWHWQDHYQAPDSVRSQLRLVS